MRTSEVCVGSFVTLSDEIIEKYENTVGIPITIKDYIGLVFNEDALEVFNRYNSEEISEKICQYLKSEIEAYV